MDDDQDSLDAKMSLRRLKLPRNPQGGYADPGTQAPKIEARKLEHHCPGALKVKYGGPRTNHPKSIFQLSGIHCKTQQMQ